MSEMKEIEVWIVIDANGDCEVAGDRDQALDWYTENVGCSGPLRVAKVTVSMRPPAETSAEAKVVVPDDAGEVIAATA
jgi:hypothetical protein